MSRAAVLTAAVLAALALSACGSSRPASAPAPIHSHVRGPGSIVFVSGAPSTALGVNNTDLVAAGSTGRVSDLTSTPAAENTAAWSPDGTHVVYVRQSSTERANGAIAFQAGVYVWSPGHGAPHRIGSCSETCSQSDFAWSPDNRHIALLSGTNGDTTVEVMNADGSGVHTVCDRTRCSYELARPMWSPDGRRLVFYAWGAPVMGGPLPSPIWSANADGSGLTKLTQPNCVPGDPQHQDCSFDTSPAWSPNGRLIAFISNRRGPARPKPFGPTGAKRYLAPIITTSIVVMHADGSHPHTIYRCASERCSDTATLAWSPDGMAVAVGPMTARDHSIRVATLTGATTRLRTCTASQCLQAEQLAWSPDGKRIAFLADGSVWTIGRDGSGLHQIASGTCCLGWVGSVSLDGAKPIPTPTTVRIHVSGSIAYGPSVNALRHLTFVSLRAGVQTLVRLPARGKEPAFSPDGSRIAFTGTIAKDYQWHILVADRNGKHARAVTDLPGTEPAWSPDGRTIAFTRSTGSGIRQWIALVSATGGHYRAVTSAGSEPSWSPDGRELVFQRRFGGVEDTLFTVGSNGRGLKRLTNLPGSQGSPAWSRDGKEIAFVWYTAAGAGLYLIHPDGTDLRRVTTASVPVGKPAWSPDGRYLLVMPDDYQATSTPVIAIDVRSGRVSTVATVPGAVTGPSWSPR